MRAMTKTRTGSLLLAATLALAVCAVALGAQRSKPTATTGSVTGVHGGTGQLNGTVHPNGIATSYYFRYGLTAAMTSRTPTVSVGSGTQPVKVGQVITGLVLGEHYQIWAVYVNEKGATAETHGRELVYGSSSSKRTRFDLGKGKEAELTAVYGQPFSFSGTLAGPNDENRQVSLQGTPYPFTEAFAALAGPVATGRYGRFVFTVARMTRNTELRVFTTGTQPIYSPVVTVQVAPRIVLHVRGYGHTGMYRLYGTVEPARNGASVAIQQLLPQKPGSSRSGPRPRQVAGAVLKRDTAKLSRFSVIVRLSGTYHYRAYVRLPKGDLASGASGDVEIKAPAASAKKKHK